MNKQLRQFERESKLEIFGLGARREIWEAALEKYAELIVRECAKVVFDKTGPKSALNVLEHFGVEEQRGWVCPKCGADRTKIACPLGFGAQVDGRCPMTAEAQ